MSEPPTVYTVCGLPASGKSTFARKLAHSRRGVCFSADEWVLKLYRDDEDAGLELSVDRFPLYRERVWELIWATARRLLELGVDVVLDFSFYKRSERNEFRRRALAAGARFRVFCMDCPREVLRARLDARNRDRPPGTFVVDDETFEALVSIYEAPSPDEMPELVHVHSDIEL